VWEALVGAGPTCSVAASESDVGAYLTAFGDLLAELTA
jgi:glutamate-1-semialdehyde 2,1-aminomutase